MEYTKRDIQSTSLTSGERPSRSTEKCFHVE